jgi:peptidoglycan-associated lipoprotein
MTMTLRSSTLAAVIMMTAVAGCKQSPSFFREAGAEVDEGGFGNPTANNYLLQTGQRSPTQMMGERFAAEVPTTINFDFNSAQLTEEARTALRRQADWIRQFPEVRFRVYGHTDLVGSNAYNQALGLRRAKAVVSYFATQGISPSRLEALVSYGETRPVIRTQEPEVQNRRTVTEVSGFVKSRMALLNGKYAEVIFREYVQGATRVHPSNTVVATQVDPGN